MVESENFFNFINQLRKTAGMRPSQLRDQLRKTAGMRSSPTLSTSYARLRAWNLLQLCLPATQDREHGTFSNFVYQLRKLKSSFVCDHWTH